LLFLAIFAGILSRLKNLQNWTEIERILYFLSRNMKVWRFLLYKGELPELSVRRTICLLHGVRIIWPKYMLSCRGWRSMLLESSLTGEANKDKGLRAGFDHYEYKLDRIRLLDSIYNILHQRTDLRRR